MTYYRDALGVSVIGFSFRVPGGADETLWQALLVAAICSIRSNPTTGSKIGLFLHYRLNRFPIQVRAAQRVIGCDPEFVQATATG
jgi:hypothetical protein